jgi:hypothetical protein
MTVAVAASQVIFSSEGRTQHVAGELAAAFGLVLVHAHLVSSASCRKRRAGIRAPHASHGMRAKPWWVRSIPRTHEPDGNVGAAAVSRLRTLLAPDAREGLA